MVRAALYPLTELCLRRLRQTNNGTGARSDAKAPCASDRRPSNAQGTEFRNGEQNEFRNDDNGSGARPNSFYLSTRYLAGAEGIEPGDGGMKIRCLTAWLRPIRTAHLRDGRVSGTRERTILGWVPPINHRPGSPQALSRRRGDEDRRSLPMPISVIDRRSSRPECRGGTRSGLIAPVAPPFAP